MKVQIIYWSGSGHTEKLANDINSEISKKYETSIKFVSDASLEDVNSADIVLLGCPAMGSEELEDMEFAPFYESIKSALTSKKVGLFGTHEWSEEGEWMQTWHEDAKSAGINVVAVCPVHESQLDDFSVSDFVSKF